MSSLLSESYRRNVFFQITMSWSIFIVQAYIENHVKNTFIIYKPYFQYCFMNLNSSQVVSEKSYQPLFVKRKKKIFAVLYIVITWLIFLVRWFVEQKISGNFISDKNYLSKFCATFNNLQVIRSRIWNFLLFEIIF